MADFDDRYSAATDADPFGFNDLYDKRAKLGPAPPKSDPIPGIVHGAIPGILGVDAGNIDPSSGRAMPGGPSSADPVGALGLWGRNSGVADRWRHLTGQGDPKVQQDRALSDAPSRTDTPPNTPMNGGLAPPTMGQGFGPNVAGGPMGWANPGGPPPARPAAQPSPAPLGPTQPVRAPALPPPVQPQPAAQPASAPAPTAPEHDNNIIPKDSLLGRIFAGVRQQNPVLGGLGGLSDWTKDNRLTMLAMAGGLAGSQSLGQGLGRAFTAAVPAAQADQAQQNQSATASLLMQKMPGLTPDQALAMSRNPDIMKQLIPNMFGAKQKKWTTIGHDRYGNPEYGFVDEVSGKVYDTNNNEVHPAAGAGGPTGDVANLHGDDYIKTLEPSYGNQVRAIVEGRTPYPTGMFAKTPAGQRLQTDVTQTDPDFDVQNAGARQKAYNNWQGSGKGADTYRALNQLAEHAESMARSIDELGNWSLGKAVNAPVNEVAHTFGGAIPYQDVQVNAHALADEMSKLWKGSGHATDSEIRSWEEKFPANGSKAQQKAYLKKGMDLVTGAVESLDNQRKNELGRAAERLPDPAPAASRERIDRVKAWSTSGEGGNRRIREIPPAPKPGAVVPDPKTGRPFRFKGGDPAHEKNWEPVE